MASNAFEKKKKLKCDEFSVEIRNFSKCEDTNLPPFDQRIDSWWAAAAGEFPMLSLAYLTIIFLAEL